LDGLIAHHQQMDAFAVPRVEIVFFGKIERHGLRRQQTGIDKHPLPLVRADAFAARRVNVRMPKPHGHRRRAFTDDVDAHQRVVGHIDAGRRGLEYEIPEAAVQAVHVKGTRPAFDGRRRIDAFYLRFTVVGQAQK
jgi:hypothetical protein